jgi:hypothetical protein
VTLEALYLAAWVEGLRQRTPQPAAVRPVTLPARYVRLDDTGRAPTVPLRPAGGPQ